MFQETIAPNIADILLAKDGPLFPIFDKIDASEVSKLKGYLLNQLTEEPDFLNGQRLTEAEKDRIDLYKEQISNLLSLTLSRIPNVDVGFPRDKITRKQCGEIPMPYRGNETPKDGSSFANPYEPMNYAIQFNKIFGISENILTRFIQSFRENAELEKQASGGIVALRDTQAAKQFAEMTDSDRDLFDIQPDNTVLMSEIHAEGKISKNQKVIDYCLENFILNEMECYTKIIRQNSFNHASLYRSVQGFSGTILSNFIFDERMKFNKKFAKGTDGKTIDHLLRKKSKVHVATSADPFDTIRSLLDSHSDFRALIDVGSYFMGIDNLTVAKALAKYFKDPAKGQNVQYILYYNTEDKLCALNLSLKEPELSPILIGSSDPKNIEAALGGCGPDKRFTFYDDLRITGTDIKQKTNARALVTFGSHTILRDILQGPMRMRDLAGTHFIEIIIPKDVAQAYPEIKEWNIETVINFADKNQKRLIKEYRFRAAMEKLKNVVRENLLTRVKEERNPIRKQQLFDAFQEMAITTQSQSPHVLFGHIERLERIEVVMADERKRLFEYWENSLLSVNITPDVREKATIERKLDKIVHKVLSKKLCAETVKVPTRANKDLQVQTVSETDAHTETQHQNQKQMHLELQLFSLDEGKFKKPFFPWDEELDLRKIDLRTYQDGKNCFKALNTLLDEGPSKNKPKFKFANNIFMSSNFINTYEEQGNALLDGYFKPVHRVLMVQDKKEPFALTAYIITQPEEEQFGRMLQKQMETRMDGPDMWIITPDNELKTGGELPKVLGPQYAETLEQLWYINGSTNAMTLNRDKLSWLLQDDYLAKKKYYEEVILPCYPNKKAGYRYLEEGLDSRCGIVRGSVKEEDVKRSIKDEEVKAGAEQSVAVQHSASASASSRTLLLYQYGQNPRGSYAAAAEPSHRSNLPTPSTASSRAITSASSSASSSFIAFRN